MAAEIKKPSPPREVGKGLHAVVLVDVFRWHFGLQYPPRTTWILALICTRCSRHSCRYTRSRATGNVGEEARLLRDVERGLIECAIRYPQALPGSLSSRWERGFAEVNNGTIEVRTSV